MKTQEQIARNEAENFVMDVTLGVRKLHADDLTPCIESAINEAIQQERERTCEWVLDGHAVVQFFNTGCGVNFTRPYGTYCAHCGGVIVSTNSGGTMSKTLEEIASDTANRIIIRPSGTNMTPVILDSLRLVERQTVERCEKWMQHYVDCPRARFTSKSGHCTCGLAALKKESEGK